MRGRGSQCLDERHCVLLEKRHAHVEGAHLLDCKLQFAVTEAGAVECLVMDGYVVVWTQSEVIKQRH